MDELSSMLEPEISAGASGSVPVASRYIRFGPLQVDQDRLKATKSGVDLKLQGKAYQVLVALIEKQGELVTREELRALLWSGDTRVKYDANVNTTVNRLRQVIGASFIETVPRKGYYLVAHPKNGAMSVPTAAARRSNVWIVPVVIALILAGMLLGAGVILLTHNIALHPR